jgi:hypothetical protein
MPNEFNQKTEEQGQQASRAPRILSEQLGKSAISTAKLTTFYQGRFCQWQMSHWTLPENSGRKIHKAVVEQSMMARET